MSMIQNPVIPGFHPDPSICRVGDTYYLVTSSFEYFPGVPVYRSKNLRDWKLIGHCLTRVSQLPLKDCPVSGGIYAPTIRFHNGVFFMVTTNVSGGGNFIVHTKDPAGEWSEPAWVRQKGIDPSLLFYEDRCYFVSTADCGGNPGIYLCEVDPFTGEMKSESRLISKGCGGKCPEAPHVYAIDGRFYLMLAEGGTEYGHGVVMMRSASLYGPYEPCPHNPILSNRDLCPGPAHPSCTGHGDLVQAEDGSWWMVALGVRNLRIDGRNVMLHNLGRETCLVPVLWRDGWCTAGENGILSTEISVPFLPEPVAQTVKAPLLRETFQSSAWNPEFTQIRNPDPACYRMTGGKLVLTGRDGLPEPGISPTFLGVRQTEFCQRVRVMVSGMPEREDALAGLTVYYHNEHHYEIGLGLRNGTRSLVVRRQIYDLIREDVICPWDAPEASLEITADFDTYCLWYFENGSRVMAGKGTTAAFATEITRRMTFTGTFFGMFAEHMRAEFREFSRENG